MAARSHAVASVLISYRSMLSADGPSRPDLGLSRGDPLARIDRAGGMLGAAYALGDRDEFALLVKTMCGLGPGLTPAGDDWLAGWLLAGWLEAPWAEAMPGALTDAGPDGFGPAGALLHPERRERLREMPCTDCRTENEPSATAGRSTGLGAAEARSVVLAAAETRTTTISRAFLACAAEGEADAGWHDLLAALAWDAASRRLPNGRSPLGLAASAVVSHGATSGAAMLAGFLTGLYRLNEAADGPLHSREIL
jgi:hypothetical protein